MTAAPIGYLVTAALACGCTLMALAPPRRPLALGIAAFLGGFALNELPFAAWAYLLAATLLAGAASTPRPAGRPRDWPPWPPPGSSSSPGAARRPARRPTGR
jgi:hypothetical protein